MKTIKQATAELGYSKTILYRKLDRINEFDKYDPENNQPRYRRTPGGGASTRVFTDRTIEKIKNLPPLPGYKGKK